MGRVLHVGADHAVFLADVIMILDAKLFGKGVSCRHMISFAREQGKLLDLCTDLGMPVESVLVLNDGMVLSPLSLGTLRRRIFSAPAVPEAALKPGCADESREDQRRVRAVSSVL